MLSIINPAMPEPDHQNPPVRRRRTSSYLALAGRLVVTRLAERLRPLGIAPAQFLVLNELWDTDALTQRALVDRIGVEQATMAATLKRMERDGLITRHPCPGDDRARIIRLTAAARALAEPATAIAASLDAEAMGPLTPGGETALRALLVRLVSGLQDGVARN